MNTIKFSNMYEPRTETHNVEVYDKNTLIINNKTYIVDSHSQIMIYPTLKCNADCDFCLNKFDKSLCKCKENLTEKQYINKLEDIFKMLGKLKPYISICGGEPSLSPLTIEILKLANEYSINHRIFATNGSGLLNIYENKPLLQHMKENNAINNINISKASFDDEINYNIMKYNLSNDKLKTIATFCNVNNMSARMSCLLHKNGITNLENIINYHETSKQLGFKSEIFREQIKVDKNLKENNIINIKPIMLEISKDKRFSFIRNLEGAYYNVKVYKYKDSIVKCYEEKFQTETKFIRDFVFLPDGGLYIAQQYNDDIKIL